MKIIDFQDAKNESSLLKSCAELYCQIWREPPWNENFWTVSGVLSDIEQQLSKACSEGFLAVNGSNEAIGFTWGYPVSKNNMRKISKSSDLDFVFEKRKKVFYVDELGVGSNFRIRGVGKSISETLITAAKRHGVKCFILRTDEKALAARVLYQKLGFRELDARDGEFTKRTYWLLEI